MRKRNATRVRASDWPPRPECPATETGSHSTASNETSRHIRGKMPIVELRDKVGEGPAVAKPPSGMTLMIKQVFSHEPLEERVPAVAKQSWYRGVFGDGPTKSLQSFVCRGSCGRSVRAAPSSAVWTYPALIDCLADFRNARNKIPASTRMGGTRRIAIPEFSTRERSNCWAAAVR